MFKLEIRWPSGEVTDFTVDKDIVTLGRAPENDIYLPSQEASRHHASVYKKRNAIYIEDMQSANGTFVDNTRISSPTLVSPGDPIKLADVFIRIYHSGARPRLENESNKLGEQNVAARLGSRTPTLDLDTNTATTIRKSLTPGNAIPPSRQVKSKK